MIKNISIICLISTLIACDCYIHKSGFVLDTATNDPIPGALVKLDKLETFTDSTGYFLIERITGFCPKWELSVSKNGYKPFQLKIDLKRDHTIYKVLNQKEFEKFLHVRYLNEDSSNYIVGEWINLNSDSFTVVNSDSIIIRLKK
jgi:hypothetical protein